ARTPGVIALAGGALKRERLLAQAQRAADAARDLIARRQAVGVGDAVRVPLELERHRNRLAALAAQQRSGILVRLPRRLELHAEALERRQAAVLGAQARRPYAQVLALGERRGPVDDRDGRPFGSAYECRVPAHAQVWVGADANVR